MFNHQPVFERNRARAGSDIPHMLLLGFVYELPLGKRKKKANSGAVQWILGGWQINGVFAAEEGIVCP